MVSINACAVSVLIIVAYFSEIKLVTNNMNKSMEKYLKKKKYIKKCPNIIVDFPSKRKSQYMPTVPINKRN